MNLDKTFCAQFDCAKRHECDRFLSDKVEKAASDNKKLLSMALFTDCYKKESHHERRK